MVVAWLVALAIAIIVAVVAQVIIPKPKLPKPDAAKDLDDPTCEAGRPIPVIFGTLTIKSLNVLWFGDKSVNQYTVKV